MAEQPRKKVKIVAKKRSAPSEGAAVGTGDHKEHQSSARDSSSKSEKGSLLDVSKLFDFPAGMADGAREIWMAGIGALSTVEEAGQAVYQELVRKGEKWEKESREKLRGARDQATSAAGRAASTAGGMARAPMKIATDLEAQIERVVEDSIEGVLHRLGVPTRAEVQELITRVESLSDRVDGLLDALSQSSEPEPPATFSVVKDATGWHVRDDHSGSIVSTHATKSDATSSGRSVARSHSPSELVILRADGTQQDRISYDD